MKAEAARGINVPATRLAVAARGFDRGSRIAQVLIVRRLAQAIQDADAVVGDDKLEVFIRPAKRDNSVLMSLAVLVDVVIHLAHSPDHSECHGLRQRTLRRFLRLRTE